MYEYMQKEAPLPLAVQPATTEAFIAVDTGLCWVTGYIYMNVNFIPWFKRPHRKSSYQGKVHGQ